MGQHFSIIVAVVVVSITYVIFFKSRQGKIVAKRAPFVDESPEFKVPYSGKNHWSYERNKLSAIKYAAKGIASEAVTPATTVPKLFKKAAMKSGAKPAMRIERPCPLFDEEGKRAPPSAPFEEWKTWTYQQYYDECCSVGRAFLALGLKQFDAVTIYGFNSPEWYMAQIGGIMAGGIAAGIYPSDTPEQVIYKAKHSSASIAVCQNGKQGIFEDAVRNGELPNLKAIVVWGGPIAADSKVVNDRTRQSVSKFSWEDLPKLAERTPMQELERIMNSAHPGQVCCYIYTSGTTGNPKAVMITHDNIVWEAIGAKSILPKSFGTEEERVLSYLPLSHVAGCMVDIVMPMVTTANDDGYVICAFARPYDLSKFSFGDRLKAVKPTLFLGVPRVWEKIAEKVQKIGASTKGLKKKISAVSKSVGLEYALNCQLGGSGMQPGLYPIANKAVFSKVKEALGLQHCKYGFTGAAPISFETLSYFGSLGIQINEVYGMSECTGATTFSNSDHYIWGSCGWTMPGTEVKIFSVNPADINDKKECPLADDITKSSEAEQGEICFRGRHIMAGYMGNPDLGKDHIVEIAKKNREAIDNEGWLHSGDKGCMGRNGMLKITGRYKDLIIGSGGENIAPVPVEDCLKKLCPFLSNAVMIGDKRKFNVILVSLKSVGATGEKPGSEQLDPDVLQYVSPGVTTVTQARADEKLIRIIKKAVDTTNKDGSAVPSNAASVQKFSILPVDFSVETDELTPTLKTKRPVVAHKYARLIDSMYEEGARDYVPFRP